MVWANFRTLLLLAATLFLYTACGVLQKKIYFSGPYDDIRRKIENISLRIDVADYRTSVESWFVVLLLGDVQRKFNAMLDGQMSIWALDGNLLDTLKTNSHPSADPYINSLQDYNNRMTLLESKAFNDEDKHRLYVLTQRVNEQDEHLQELCSTKDLNKLTNLQQRVNALQAHDITTRLDELEKRFNNYIDSLVSKNATNEFENNLVLLEERVSVYKQKLETHKLPRNCLEAMNRTVEPASGIYEIAIGAYHNLVPFHVYCDASYGGGWIVVQRRLHGTVDFYRYWEQYQHGFGDLNTDFFIGLDKLHALTATKPPPELLIVLRSYQNQTKIAHYSSFVIGDEHEAYALKELGHYDGTAGDSLRAHVHREFSTRDNDYTAKHCARAHKGAWWFYECVSSHLNAPMIEVANGEGGIQWKSFGKKIRSLQFAQMMIRPTSI